MIKQIKIEHLDWKENWIDHNNVVFGYSKYQCCCESFGCGVYDPVTKMKVADDMDGLPYHFDFTSSAREDESPYEYIEYPDVLDVAHVTLIHDEDETKKLIFECWCNHNGYYYHDFSFKKREKGANDENIWRM
jgi:hypothetical protein